MAKLVNIWTIHETKTVLYFSLRKLKIAPPTASPVRTNKNRGKENQPIIIAVWYNENNRELNKYAVRRLEDRFRFVKTNPRKKNSSKRELMKETYSATKMKFFPVTPTEAVREVATLEKSKMGDRRK